MQKPWVIPFAIQLLGEYVLPIAQRIEANLAEANINLYVDFLRRNERYFQTTERRAISYWNVYYRGACPTWREYPASRALLAIRRAYKLANRSLAPTNADS